MIRQYSSVVWCANCGFNGRVVNEVGKIFKEIDCPNCGTPNLQIWNMHFAQTQHIQDGLVGRMVFEVRDKTGKFVSKDRLAELKREQNDAAKS